MFMIPVDTHIHIVSLPDFWVRLFNQAVHETGLNRKNNELDSQRSPKSSHGISICSKTFISSYILHLKNTCPLWLYATEEQ